MEKMLEICSRICPQTLTINTIAIGISLTDVEVALKLLSYFVAIVWTTLRVAKELRDWNKNGKA